MRKTLISVIIPVYNTVPWLPRCLDSICAQSYSNIEILCVNDGSTDNSAEILEEYAAKDPRIKVFNQKNAGLSAARNTGLEHAKGEWVTGVDSDDYLLPDAFKKALSYEEADVDLIFFGICCISENDNILISNSYFNLLPEGKYKMSPELAGKLNVCFCGKLWRRSIIEDNQLCFPEGLVHEDEAMYYLSCPNVRKFAISSTYGYVYLQREGSITNDRKVDNIKRLRRYISILEYVYDEYKSRNLLDNFHRAYLSVMFVKLLAWVHRISNISNKRLCITLARKCVTKCCMQNYNYHLERLIPYEKHGLVTVRRYARVKVYYFLLIPIRIKIYNRLGHLLTLRTLVMSLRKLFLRGSNIGIASKKSCE